MPNVFSFATEGKSYRYGSVRMPVDKWGPWHEGVREAEGTLASVRRSVRAMLQPGVVLDILQNFTLFATDKKHRSIKVICRYQQYEAANLIVSRVVTGYPRKGLIWHFQGSGKSLLMVFASQKLRMHPKLGNQESYGIALRETAPSRGPARIRRGSPTVTRSQAS